MRYFSGNVEIQELNETEWTLKEDVSFTNEHLEIIVKSGFITDGSSIPKLFWSIVGSPLEADLLLPSIIHDGLYTDETLPRDICDNLLREMLLLNGVSQLKANLIYSAVRMFGASHFESDDTALEDKVQHIEVLVAGNYVKRTDMDALTTALFAKLDKIENKLDGKVDK